MRLFFLSVKLVVKGGAVADEKWSQAGVHRNNKNLYKT